MTDFVQIKRTDSDEIGSCSRAALPVWLARGYELYEEPEPEVDAPTNEEPVAPREATDIEKAQKILDAVKDNDGELYDPTDHSVAEVLDYLADKDPEEIARVLEAEAAGKDRKGVAEGAPTPIVPDPNSGGGDGDVVVDGKPTEGPDSEQNVDGSPAVQDPADEQ